jgi:hypothetical protein
MLSWIVSKEKGAKQGTTKTIRSQTKS